MVIRHLMALCGTAALALALTATLLLGTGQGLGTPDAIGLLVGGVILAVLCCVALYLPVALALERWRRESVRARVLALAVGANLPVFGLLLALDQRGGFFGAGEALIVGALALVLGGAYGTLARR